MFNQDMQEINDLQLLEYDVFGKCNDMLCFINFTRPILKGDPQINIKISAIAKLINQLIKLLKDSDSSYLYNLPEYHDIVYLLKNNLSNNLRIQATKIQQLETSNQESKNQISIQAETIQKLRQELLYKDKENSQLQQEIKALKHQMQQIEDQEYEIEKVMNNQNQNLNENNNLLQNEIIQLKHFLELKENRIEYQEGEIKLLKLQVQKLKGDCEGSKHNLFYEQQQIFMENQELLNQINQLSLQQNNHIIQNAGKRKEPQNGKKRKEAQNTKKRREPQNEEQNKKQVEKVEKLQNRIFNFLKYLSLHGFLLNA